MNKFLLQFSGLVAISLLHACSKVGPDAGASAKKTVNGSGQENVLCEFTPKDGGGVNVALLNSRVTVERASFGKEYRSNWLKAIYDSSIEETISSVSTLGVDLYQSGAKGKSECKSFISLEKMPTSIEKLWNKATEEDDKDGYVAGLYLPKGTSQKISELENQSAIILRINQSRYTLVHEFMHHNFHEQARIKGLYSPDDLEKLKSEAKILDAAMSGFGEKVEDVSDEQWKTLFDDGENRRAIVALFKTYDQIFLNTTFEEMTIEHLLISKIESGDLKFVPKESRAASSWYIRYSAKKAAESYSGKVFILLSELNRAATKLSHPFASDLNSLKALFQSRVTEANQILAKHLVNIISYKVLADHIGDSFQPGADHVVTSPVLAPKSGCSGSKDTEKADEIMGRIGHVI